MLSASLYISVCDGLAFQSICQYSPEELGFEEIDEQCLGIRTLFSAPNTVIGPSSFILDRVFRGYRAPS
jgi:hypothetical protein